LIVEKALLMMTQLVSCQLYFVTYVVASSWRKMARERRNGDLSGVGRCEEIEIFAASGWRKGKRGMRHWNLSELNFLDEGSFRCGWEMVDWEIGGICVL
jgi:hypothetical protein